MEAWLAALAQQLPLAALFAVIAGAILVLVKGADLLVEQAVALSLRWGVPTMLIGATIVSIGTTLPEASVSVFAALQGAPGLALGNAVGSIIADTGLILGLAIIIGRVPVEKRLVSRQSWIQVASAVLLVAVCVPYLALRGTFSDGGRLPQFMGIAFLVLLALYLWRSIAWSKDAPAPDRGGGGSRRRRCGHPASLLLKLVAGLAMVVVGSRLLIPAVEETALATAHTRCDHRCHAGGVRHLAAGAGHLGDGGAQGTRRAGDRQRARRRRVERAVRERSGGRRDPRRGLEVPPQFFFLFFPSMLFVVLVLRVGVSRAEGQFSKGFGFVLLVAYLITVVLGYVVPGAPGDPHG